LNHEVEQGRHLRILPAIPDNFASYTTCRLFALAAKHSCFHGKLLTEFIS
jgi:hypothetical protein